MSEEIERLVRQARAGDREAAGALWQRHRRLVATVLLAHGDVRELDDLLQEVALRVTRSLDGLADAGSLRAWLRTVARRVAIDHGRRSSSSRLRPVPDEAAAEREPVFDAAEQQRWRDELEHALRRVADLEPQFREPLLLRAVEGLTQREVADVLGVPETTVETRLARARRHLRERVEAERSPDTQPVERHDRIRRTVD